jgi:hypothetical protein
VNAEDWTELTAVFNPVEHMEDLVKLLGEYRAFAGADDNVYLLTDRDVNVRHATVQSKGRWICSCRDPSPCVAAVVMMVASFTWIIRPVQEDATARWPAPKLQEE